MWLTARGKPVLFTKHAVQAMACERPPIEVDEVLRALDEPEQDGALAGARKRSGRRVVIVRYEEHEDHIHVKTVSATRSL